MVVDVLVSPAEFNEQHWRIFRAVAFATCDVILPQSLKEAREQGTLYLRSEQIEQFEQMYRALGLPIEGVELRAAWSKDTSILATTYYRACKRPGQRWVVQRRDRVLSPDDAYYSEWTKTDGEEVRI